MLSQPIFLTKMISQGLCMATSAPYWRIKTKSDFIEHSRYSQRLTKISRKAWKSSRKKPSFHYLIHLSWSTPAQRIGILKSHWQTSSLPHRHDHLASHLRFNPSIGCLAIAPHQVPGIHKIQYQELTLNLQKAIVLILVHTLLKWNRDANSCIWFYETASSLLLRR